MRAPQRNARSWRVTRWALATLALLASAPRALAQSTDPAVSDRLKDSFIGGLEYVGKKIVDGTEALFGGVFGGFVDLVIKSFYNVFGEIFGGIAAGGRKLFELTLGGGGDLMKSSYDAAVRQVQGWGLAAPIASMLVLGVIVLVVVVFLRMALATADNPLPGFLERMFKDEKNER